MLAGEPFLPFHRTLIDERQQCAKAIHQFNSTASVSVEIVKNTRELHFRTILTAKWIPPQHNTQNIVSHLGHNFHVAVPFNCDYGYHLNIGDNVVIGSDCNLHDSAKICIGRNTKIGARVTIQTLKTPTDTQSLKGSSGTEVAQEVRIGENVYIGDNCVIEAGVKIGENTIVRPGSVVSRVSFQPLSTSLYILTAYRTCRATALRTETLHLFYQTERRFGRTHLIKLTNDTDTISPLSGRLWRLISPWRYPAHLIWDLHVTLRTNVWCLESSAFYGHGGHGGYPLLTLCHLSI
jgi:acetyltransferase-like isoleucine patch superfamily enzyme